MIYVPFISEFVLKNSTFREKTFQQLTSKFKIQYIQL